MIQRFAKIRDWCKRNGGLRQWAFGVGVIACVATVLAVPGMPKLFHFDKTEAVTRSNPQSEQRPQSQTPNPSLALPQSVPDSTPHQDTKRPKKAKVDRSLANPQPQAPISSPAVPASSSPVIASPGPTTQHCEGDAVCFGDNHGTVNVNKGNAPPPKRIISDENAKRALGLLHGVGPGHSVRIMANGSSKETTDFALQLHRILLVSGWQIDPSAAIRPGYSYANENGDGFSWVGKGFVCTGYAKTDNLANATINAIRATGFPCEERPLDEQHPGPFTLLVGTRGSADD